MEDLRQKIDSEVRKGGTLKTLRRNLAEEGDFLGVANEAQEILDLDPLSVVGGGGGIRKVKVAIVNTVAGRRKTILVRRGGKGGGWIVLVLVLALGHARLMVNIAIFTLKTLEDHLDLTYMGGIEKNAVEPAHLLPLVVQEEKDPPPSTTTKDQTYSVDTLQDLKRPPSGPPSVLQTTSTRIEFLHQVSFSVLLLLLLFPINNNFINILTFHNISLKTQRFIHL